MKKEMFADDGVELTEEEYAALLSWNDQDVAFVKSDKIENGEIWRGYTAGDCRQQGFRLCTGKAERS